jgi:hypothetical protein
MSKPGQPKILVLGDISLLEHFPVQSKGDGYCVDVRQETQKGVGFAGFVARYFRHEGALVAISSVVGEDSARMDVEEILSSEDIEHQLFSYYDFATTRVEYYDHVRIERSSPVEDAKVDGTMYFDWPFDAVVLVNCGLGVVCDRLRERVSRYCREHSKVKRYDLNESDQLAWNLERVLNDIRGI